MIANNSVVQTTHSRKSTGKVRSASFDLLRMLASFFVILLHVAAQGFYVLSPEWNISLLYTASTRVCVPVFIMLSGAFLVPKAETIKQTLLRTGRRVVLPYVIWSVIYLTYNKVTLGMPFSIKTIFQTAPYFHMAFMLQLLSFYIALPLLRGFWTNPATTPQSKLYVIGLSLFGGILSEFIYPLIGKSLIGFTISYLPYYIGLGMLGAYLREYKPKRKLPLLWLLGYIAGSAMTALCTWNATHAINQPTEQFFVYQSPFVIFAAASLFMFFKNVEIRGKVGKCAQALSQTTLDIYLLHPLVMNVFAVGYLGFSLTWNTWYPLVWTPIYSCIIFLVCMAISLLVRLPINAIASKLRKRS